MKKAIVITGTPGSGKTTISSKVASNLKSCELISANEIVKRKRLFSGYSKDGEMIANMKGLAKEINSMIRKSPADVIIIEGHLLCDLRVNGATAIVVREHLDTLFRRMKARHYSKRKIEGNIVSEAIDYCGVNAESNYSEVYEIQSGPSAVGKVLQVINGKRIKANDIELLHELNGMLKKIGTGSS